MAVPSTASVLRRLPYSDSYSVAAGYAMASAALLATIGFVSIAGVIATVEHLTGSIGPSLLYAVAGLLSIPLVVPSAFGSGVVVWRSVVRRGARPRRGAIGGVMAVVGTYALSTFVLVVVVTVTQSGQSVEPIEAATQGFFVAVYGFVLTAWFTVPLGVIAGWLRQRRGTERRPPSSAEEQP